MNEPILSPDVWVRLDGVITEPTEYPSSWAVGAVLPTCPDALAYARQRATERGGRVLVYGTACEGIRGIRQVQRLLNAHLLDHDWVTHELTPPAGAEVIDTWPKVTPATSPTPTPTAPSAPPETAPPSDTEGRATATSKSRIETPASSKTRRKG